MSAMFQPGAMVVWGPCVAAFAFTLVANDRPRRYIPCMAAAYACLLVAIVMVVLS